MEILHLNNDNFEKTILGDKIVLVDFWADWCNPCKLFAPTLEKVAAQCEGKAVVAKLNIDECPSIAAEYKVFSIPTLIVFENGKEARRSVGVSSKAEVMSLLGI